MIKRYIEYIKESSNYDEMLSIINFLIKNGDITLNKISSEQFAKLLSKKSKEYPQFGFESLMMNLADDKKKDFISAADQQRMGEYIDKIKEFGLDVSKLEQLYPSYEKYWKLTYKEDDIRFSYELKDNEKEQQLEELYKEQDMLSNDVNKFEEELKRLSKEVIKKL
ncbi:MAG: hypothetical protein ACOC3Z_03530 [Nanoarchaeota archaeon]